MCGRVEGVNMVQLYVVGDQTVGKSSFIKAVVIGRHSFFQSTEEIGFLSQDVQFENEKILLQLFENEPVSYNALVILYSITSRQTFESAVVKLKSIRTTNVDIPILLVANKIDRNEERCVMSYEGELVALEYHTLFRETTSKSPETMREAVLELIQAVI